MNKSTSVKLSTFVAFVLVFGIFSIKENIYGQMTNTMPNANAPLTSTQSSGATAAAPTAEGTEGQGTITRDSVTLLLEGKTLPKGDFIELYDSTPFKIVNGHFVAKVPCNANGQSQVDLLTGEAPNLKSSDAEFVSQLSSPGKLCLYHVDLVSGANNTITDVAIKNNSTNDIVFPPTSSVGIGVNSIAELPHDHE
jgi:hypothetical protein